jgi:hypothetical protein
MSLSAVYRHAKFCLGSLILAPLALAESVPDRFSIEPFPGARVTQAKVLPQTEHAVVIGLVRKVNNRLRVEREIRATGELIRVTVEIPRVHSRTEGFEYVRDQLLARPHSMLYYCEGRECGASNLWANEVLDNSRLYGPQETQDYLTVRLDEDPQRFVSVYAITGGNQRAYVHVDQFTPDEPVLEPLYPTPATMLKVLHANDQLALPGLQLDRATGEPGVEDPEIWLNLVNRMLRSDTRVRVAISGQQAPAVMQRLIDLDIRASRLEIGQPYPDTGIVLDKI